MSLYLISPNFHTLLSQGLSPLVHYFLDHSNNSVHTDVNLFLEEDRRLVLVGLVLGAVCSVLLMFNCFSSAMSFSDGQYPSFRLLFCRFKLRFITMATRSSFDFSMRESYSSVSLTMICLQAGHVEVSVSESSTPLKRTLCLSVFV